MSSNFTFSSLKKAIEEKVKESNAVTSNNVMSIHLLPKDVEKKETEDEKKKRIGVPKYSVEQLMTECDLQEQIAKLKENQIDEYTFWSLSEDDFKDVVEVKSYGKRKRLMKRMEEIKEEHEKKMEEEHKESKSVNKEDVKNLLKVNQVKG